MTSPVALSTTVWGTGRRRVLLLHGLTSAGSTWWRVGGDLADLGFTVVAPDMRAHGTSPAGDNLSIESYRDDVLLLGGGWDLLVGHSLGGAVAAAAMTAQPDFAKRIVLEDPAIDSAVTARLLAESPEPLQHPTVAAVAAANPTWHPRDVELKVEALLQCGPEVSQRTMDDAAPWDVWPDILSLPVPTLLMGADPELGALVSAAKGEEAVRTNALVKYVLVAEAGHSIHRHDYEEYLRLVSGLVDS